VMYQLGRDSHAKETAASSATQHGAHAANAHAAKAGAASLSPGVRLDTSAGKSRAPATEIAGKAAVTTQAAGTSAAAPLDFTNPLDYRNTYIITLKRDAMRTEHVRNLTRDTFVNSNIFWAIDGKNITDKTIAKWKREGYLKNYLGGVMNPKSKVGKPKISCLMSHVRLWEKLAKEKNPDAFYFIMEDDITTDVDFEEHYQNVFNELKGLTWEWVYLAIHPTFKRLNKLTIEGKNHINRSPRMVGNAGYLLSRRGAQKLLDKMFPCSLPKDQAVRILVMDGTLEAYIVKRELVVVLGQQGEGFKGSLKRDGRRKFKSNIWDN